MELDATADARAFEPVARAVEVLTPRLVIDRPGVLAFPTRGPSRYFGGDDALVATVLEALGPVGVDDARAGVADGGFAARLAARRDLVVPSGGTPAFLAPWPVAVFENNAGQMVQDVNAKQGAASSAMEGVLTGQNVPLHQAMIAMEEASVSFQLMVEVRNKLLESYQELMRMQI